MTYAASDDAVYQLNAQDQFLFIHDYTIDISLIFKGQLNEQVLRTSFGELLKTDYKAFCGRLASSASKGFVLRVPRKAKEGTDFSWYSKDFTDSPLHDFLDDAHPAPGSARLEALRDYSAIYPFKSSRRLKDFVDKEFSSIEIHCTKFKDATAILFSISHMICDGGGAKILLQAWQDKVNGEPLQPVTEMLDLPPVNDSVLQTVTDRVPWSTWKCFTYYLFLKWTQYWNAYPECRRFTLSGELVERLKRSGGNASGHNSSSFSLSSAILLKLTAAGKGLRLSESISVCPAVNLRWQFKGNETFAHNFYHLPKFTVSIADVENESISELAIQNKAALNKYIKDKNRLRLEWHLMGENLPAPFLPYYIDNMLNVSDWASFKFRDLDFKQAVVTHEEGAGKVLDMDCWMDNKAVLNGGVVLKNDGYFGDGGIVLYITMQKLQWKRAERALGDIARYIETL